MGTSSFLTEKVAPKGSITASPDTISPQLVDAVFSDLGQIV